MKFTCEKTTLQEAISTCQKAVTGKSNMAILEGIKLSSEGDMIILTGSDKDLSIETRIKADIFEPGDIVIDSKLFGDMVRKLPNDIIEISTLENNSVQIICQKSKSNLVYMNSEDYPKITSFDEKEVFDLPEILIKSMIRATIFATAQDETRPILTGVLFEVLNKKLSMVAIDGYRLALRRAFIDSNFDVSAVIPGKTLNEVSKILGDSDKSVRIVFGENHIMFKIGETKIISRLLEGEFIKYKSILPVEYNLKITANKSQLLNCIERASLIGKEGNANLIKMNIENDSLIITSNSQLGMVREEMNVILQGDKLQIAFNSKYVMDVLKILDEDEIEMEFSSSVSPCILRNKEDDSSTYMILPVRVIN